MKRNILFLFIILGLVLTEWACWESPKPCLNQDYEVLGIDTVLIRNWDGIWMNDEPADSVHTDSFLLDVSFLTGVVVNNYNPSFSLFATAPCPPPSTNWQIDSMDLVDEFGIRLDFTVTTKSYEPSTFVSSDSLDQLNNMIWDVPLNLYVNIMSEPTKGDNSFTLRIVDREGNKMEKKTAQTFIL